MHDSQPDSRPRYVRIMDDLRVGILSGDLAAGQKLPSESQLMKQYGVSRIVAVNALNALTAEGMIYRVHGKGSFVCAHENSLPGPLGTDQPAARRHIALITQGWGNHFSQNLTIEISQATLRGNLFCSQYSSHLEERSPHEIEGPLIRFALQTGAQGLLLFPAAQEVYNKELLRLADMDFPVVLLDRELIGLGFPCVQTDHRLTGRMAAQALIRSGHRRIAFCGPIEGVQPLVQRWEGFEGCLREQGLPCGGELLVNNVTKEQVTSRMENGVTAFVCGADDARPLFDAVCVLPEEKRPSILTIDKAETGDWDMRAPSCIVQDTREIAHEAVELLCQRILRTHRRYEVRKIPPRYLDNGSVRPV